MIHILGIILKTVGILLLVILLLILLLALTVLFLPFRYRAHLQKKEEGFACIKADARISWLFGAVAFWARYENETPDISIKIFGAAPDTWRKRLCRIRKGSIRKKTEARKEAAKEEIIKEETPKKETAKEETTKKETAEMKKKDGFEAKKKTEDLNKNGRKKETAPEPGSFEKVMGILGKIPEKLLNIADRLLEMVFFILEVPFLLLEKVGKKIQAGKRLKRKWEKLKKFLHSEMFRQALLHVRKELFHFLKKTAPKKAEGTILFGFEDPSVTGETLGILGMLYGKVPKEVSIIPAFEQEILRGDLKVSGSFQIVSAAGIAFRLFRDKNLRKTIQYFKHKEA